MTARKISELPDFIGKELALEAQKRGIDIFGDIRVDAISATILGLAQIITEMREELKQLKEIK